MGQPATKLDTIRGHRAGEVVRLNPEARVRPNGADTASTPAAQSHLPALLEMVSRAATAMGERKDKAEVLAERAKAAETRLTQMSERLSETENKLQAALDDMERERARAEDLGRRSAELITKTQAMLADADDRRRAAEWRAEQAEESFATLRIAVERGFAETL